MGQRPHRSCGALGEVGTRDPERMPARRAPTAPLSDAAVASPPACGVQPMEPGQMWGRRGSPRRSPRVGSGVACATVACRVRGTGRRPRGAGAGASRPAPPPRPPSVCSQRSPRVRAPRGAGGIPMDARGGRAAPGFGLRVLAAGVGARAGAPRRAPDAGLSQRAVRARANPGVCERPGGAAQARFTVTGRAQIGSVAPLGGAAGAPPGRGRSR